MQRITYTKTDIQLTNHDKELLKQSSILLCDILVSMATSGSGAKYANYKDGYGRTRSNKTKKVTTKRRNILKTHDSKNKRCIIKV